MDWRKSSYSGETNTCVEISDDLPGVRAVRDSKNPEQPYLTVSPAAWSAFVESVKADRL